MAVLAVNDAGCWILDAGSAGVLEKTVSAWSDTGCSMLDAGSAGVLEKTVSAWKDAGYWMLVVPVFLKRRFRLGRMLDAEASAGHNNTGTTSLNLNVER
jgi:hypothetical protein